MSIINVLWKSFACIVVSFSKIKLKFLTAYNYSVNVKEKSNFTKWWCYIQKVDLLWGNQKKEKKKEKRKGEFVGLESDNWWRRGKWKKKKSLVHKIFDIYVGHKEGS